LYILYSPPTYYYYSKKNMKNWYTCLCSILLMMNLQTTIKCCFIIAEYAVLLKLRPKLYQSRHNPSAIKVNQNRIHHNPVYPDTRYKYSKLKRRKINLHFYLNFYIFFFPSPITSLVNVIPFVSCLALLTPSYMLSFSRNAHVFLLEKPL